MHKPQPLSKYNELCESIDALRRRRHVSKNDLRWRRVVAEAQKLRNANQGEGWTILGLAYSTAGDVESARNCFEEAKKYPLDHGDRVNMFLSLINLGFFSESLQMFKDLAAPERGQYSEMAIHMLQVGAFQTMQKYREKAEAMKIELNKVENHVLDSACAFLEAAGLTDEDVALHLDAAGNVLRAHGLFPLGSMVINQTPGVLSGIMNVFNVPASPDETFDMNVELAMEEERLGVKKTGFFEIAFAPVEQ